MGTHRSYDHGVADWKNATSSRAGILRPREFATHAEVERLPCSSDLRPWVENFWCLRWDLPPGSSYLSSTLPHPACNLTLELGAPRPGVGVDRVVVTGVVTERFDVPVVDHGWVLGVKFRPGGLAAYGALDARALVDRTVPASSVLPPAICGRDPFHSRRHSGEPSGRAGRAGADHRAADRTGPRVRPRAHVDQRHAR